MKKYNFDNSQKGENGTVLIIGGSKLYTGAAFFSANAAFICGVDMIYVFTADEAIIPLKILLPEAIISPIEYQEWILKRINVCILGPGLGKLHQKTLKIIKNILKFLNDLLIPIILDGDGIRCYEDLEISSYQNIIFTPNFKEATYISNLNTGQYLLKKGKIDEIYSNKFKKNINNTSCKKRISGQGDILTGILAALLIKINGIKTEEKIFDTLCLSSSILRTTGNVAFNCKGISTITRDIINELPNVFSQNIKDKI